MSRRNGRNAGGFGRRRARSRLERIVRAALQRQSRARPGLPAWLCASETRSPRRDTVLGRAYAVSAAAGIRLAGGGSVRLTLRISSKPSTVGIPKSAMTASKVALYGKSRAWCADPAVVTSAPALSRTTRSRPSVSSSSSTARTCTPFSRSGRPVCLGTRFEATALTVPRRAAYREQSSAGALSRSRRSPARRSTR